MLQRHYEVEGWVKTLKAARESLMDMFRQLDVVEIVYPSDANFFLTKVTDAGRIYDYLVDKGIIIRNRSSVKLCDQCLRITVGTPHENNALVEALKAYNK
jgi:histidinol-phosphate aminotransferase